MDTFLQNVVIAGLLLLVILVTGFWVSRSGKPINMIKMNIHKLIALGTAIFISLIVYRASKGISLNTMEIATLAASVVFAITAIITGGLASLAKPIQMAAIIHKITPYLAILSTAAFLNLMFWN